MAQFSDLWPELAGVRRGRQRARCGGARPFRRRRDRRITKRRIFLHECAENAFRNGRASRLRASSSALRTGRWRWRGASRSSRDGSAKARRTCGARCSAASPSPENFMPTRQASLACWSIVIQEQGRYQEAEQLQRQVIEIYQGLGYGVEFRADGQCPGVPGSDPQPGAAIRRSEQALRPDRRLDREVGAVAPRSDQRRAGARVRNAGAGQLRQRAGDRPAHVRPRTRQIGRQELQYRGRTRLSTRLPSPANQSQRSAAGLQGIDPGVVDGLGRQRR